MDSPRQFESTIDSLVAALNVCGSEVECRPCSLCEGEDDGHHWIEGTDDDLMDGSMNHPLIVAGVAAFFVCKHCEAWRIMTDEDDTDG